VTLVGVYLEGEMTIMGSKGVSGTIFGVKESEKHGFGRYLSAGAKSIFEMVVDLDL
jgi:hypothetical protein